MQGGIETRRVEAGAVEGWQEHHPPGRAHTTPRTWGRTEARPGERLPPALKRPVAHQHDMEVYRARAWQREGQKSIPI